MPRSKRSSDIRIESEMLFTEILMFVAQINKYKFTNMKSKMGQSRKLFRGQVRLQQEFLCLSPYPSVWQYSQCPPLPFRILILFRINKFLSRATDFIWFHCWVGFIFVNPEFIFFCPQTKWNRHSITEQRESKLSIATKSDLISVLFKLKHL